MFSKSVRGLLYSGLFLALQVQANEGIFGGGRGGHCDPDHCRPPGPPAHYSVDECVIPLPNGQEAHLNHIPRTNGSGAPNIEQALAVLDDTQTGAPLAQSLREQIASGRVQLRDLHAGVRNEFRLPEGVMAQFAVTRRTDTIPESRAIYVDSSKDVGLVAVFLAHETAHSLDEQGVSDLYLERDEEARKRAGLEPVWQEAARRLRKPVTQLTDVDFTPQEKQRMDQVIAEYQRAIHPTIYRAERGAFNVQDQFVREVTARAGCYGQFLENHRQWNRFVISQQTPDDFIISRYNLRRQYLQLEGAE